MYLATLNVRIVPVVTSPLLVLPLALRVLLLVITGIPLPGFAHRALSINIVYIQLVNVTVRSALRDRQQLPMVALLFQPVIALLTLRVLTTLTQVPAAEHATAAQQGNIVMVCHLLHVHEENTA